MWGPLRDYISTSPRTHCLGLGQQFVAMAQVQESGAIAETLDWWDLEYTELDEQLTCPICCTAFVDPYCTDCGHTFCNECLLSSCRISDSEHSSAICPVDRRPVESCPRPAPYLVKQLLDELVVKCPYSDRGCDFEGKRWLLESHIATECGYVKVYCHSNCEQEIERRLWKESGCGCNDVNGRISDSVSSDSSDGGSDKSEFSDSQTSHEDDARSEIEDDILRCSGSSLGCSFQCNKSELDEFTEHCNVCTLSKITSALEIQQTKVDDVERENRALKRQLDTLHRLAKKGSTVLDAEILAEYDRIIHEVRVTQSSQSAHQSMIANLGAENARLAGELSLTQGIVDSLRRQMFHFTQSQRRMSMFNAMQPTPFDPSALATNDDGANDEQVKMRSKQKL